MTIKERIIYAALFIRYTIGSFVALCFIALPFYLIFVLNVRQGFHLACLMWSFFVLCFPFGITSSLFNLPFWFATGRSFPFAEPFSWAIAIALNYYTYFNIPLLYFRVASTHMLYQILSNPWPYWFIIASCASAMLFRTIGRFTIRPRSFIKFHLINLAFIIVGFTLLIQLAYHELVIILNIQA